MNKIYTQLFLCLLISSAAFAQIPNPSFETWTSYTGGEYPTSWTTSDSTYQGVGAGHSAVRELTDHCDGSYALRLISVSALGNSGPGLATNGKVTGITLSNFSGGSPFMVRAAKLQGCFKYVPTLSDSGRISAYLLKWNGSSRDTIAVASKVATASGGLVDFQTDFVYRSPNSPDTILVILLSGQGLNQTNAGSYLIVDSIQTSGVVGINEISRLNNVYIFPQPAQNELNIQVELNQAIQMTYEIADITGRKIITGKMESLNQRIDISRLNRGNYFVSLRNEMGAILHASKLIVSK